MGWWRRTAGRAARTVHDTVKKSVVTAARVLKFFADLPIESLYTSLPTTWEVYVHLLTANHPKG
jgi:hypothetical protein